MPEMVGDAIDRSTIVEPATSKPEVSPELVTDALAARLESTAAPDGISGPADQFSAADAALGFLYQFRCALVLLLDSSHSRPDTKLTIERLDDIAFELDGSLELVQTKYRVRSRADLSDASPDLWKTLRVWIERLRSGTIQCPGTVLSLLTTQTAPVGTAVGFLTKRHRDVDLALARLEAAAAASHSAANRAGILAFTGLGDTQKRELLSCVYVLDAAPDMGTLARELRDRLSLSARSAHLARLVEELEGWWLLRVIEYLTSPSARPITRLVVEEKLHDLRDQLRREALSIDFLSLMPTVEQRSAHAERTFVRQAKLINLSRNRIQAAVGDFYRAFRQRSKWIGDEALVDDELATYDSRLTDEWQRKLDMYQEDIPDGPQPEELVSLGRRLYNWAHDCYIFIRPDCSEPYVYRGSYQILADQLRVGWHPSYRDLCTEAAGQ